MEKGNIIKNAMLKLGAVTDYNDDRSRRYNVFSNKLEDVVRNINADNSFRFNSATVNLTEFSIVGSEYRYNLPNDFLGIGRVTRKQNAVTGVLRSVREDMSYRKTHNFRIEGEYIYANTSSLRLNYVRHIALTEMPDYLENYISWCLAKECAIVFPEFTDRLQYCETQVSKELFNVQKREGVGEVYFE